MRRRLGWFVAMRLRELEDYEDANGILARERKGVYSLAAAAS